MAGLSQLNDNGDVNMMVYKITLEVELKEDCLYKNDFIYNAIEKELETGEQILDYEYAEVTKW